MSIVLKHIWRNIKDKKLMSALIIMSLAVSGALLFVALSISAVMDTVTDSELQPVATFFLLIFIVTSFMSVFIVISSFKYIVLVRIKTLGTLRSIGADKRRCRNLFLLESAVYGFISSIIAVAAGVILLLILGNSLSNGKATLVISPVNILICISFCLILGPSCAFFPVKGSEKYSVKGIILQMHIVREKKRLPVLTAGLAFIAAGILFLSVETLKYEEWAIYCALLFSLTGFVLCVGPLVHYITVLLGKVFRDNFTLRNMRESRSHNNIAVLLAIAVAVVFMINSANSIMVDATDKSFDLYNYNVHIAVNYDSVYDDNDIATIESIIGISDGNAAGIYYCEDVAAGDNIPIMNLYGMCLQKMAKFFNFATEKAISSQERNTILLSRDYLDREKLAAGDTLTVKGVRFKIAGVIKDFLNNGNVGVISESDFEEIFGAAKYNLIAAQSTNPNASRDALRAEGYITAVTIEDMLTRFKRINADFFTALNYIILLSTTAGVFGVLNNLFIALASKKREMALLRTIGMSLRKNAETIILENVITGLLGGLLGLLGGLLLTATMPAVFLVFEFPVTRARLSPAAVALCIACSTGICLLASLISLAGNKKINIVRALGEEVL